MRRWFASRLARNKARCLQIRNRWYPEPEWPGEIYLDSIRSTPGDVLVEIGCGWRADMLLRAADRFRLKIGIDPDCLRAKIDDPSIDLIVGDATALPLGDESADVVAMANVAEHLPDPAIVFRECFRILRPGGRFIVHTVNRRFPPIAMARVLPHSIRTVLNRVTSGTHSDDTFPVFYRANTATAIRRLGEWAGFAPSRIEYLSHHPTYLLFSPIVYRLGILAERVVRRRQSLAWLRHMIHAEIVKPVHKRSGPTQDCLGPPA